MTIPNDFKIEIIKNPTRSLKQYKNSSGFEERESIDNYIDEPFSVYINSIKLENVKRFAIDLDKSKLTTTENNGNGIYTKLADWNYLVEYGLTLE